MPVLYIVRLSTSEGQHWLSYLDNFRRLYVMIDANKTIEAIDKKLKEEEAKGTAKEYLLKFGFSFEEKNIPNVEKTKSEITDKKDN